MTPQATLKLLFQRAETTVPASGPDSMASGKPKSSFGKPKSSFKPNTAPRSQNMARNSQNMAPEAKIYAYIAKIWLGGSKLTPRGGSDPPLGGPEGKKGSQGPPSDSGRLKSQKVWPPLSRDFDPPHRGGLGGPHSREGAPHQYRGCHASIQGGL